MYPYPIFTLFGLDVYLYGVMIATGMLGCFFTLWGFSKKKGISQDLVDFIFYDGMAAIAIGFVGATLVQSVLNYLKNPEGGFEVGGMSFMPGFICGALAFFGIYLLWRKKLKSRMTDILPLLPSCVLIAHGFGRIGCFFAGCCYGAPTDFFLGVVFPRGSHAYLNGAARHPTQLYEATFLFLAYGILSYLYLKRNFKHTLSAYFCSYAVFRFLIEFVRDDERGANILGLSPSHFWSIWLFLAGVGAYFFVNYLNGKRAEELKNEKTDAPAPDSTENGEEGQQ